MSYVARHGWAKAEQIETAKKRNVLRACVGLAGILGALSLTCLGVGYEMHKKADQLTIEATEYTQPSRLKKANNPELTNAKPVKMQLASHSRETEDAAGNAALITGLAFGALTFAGLMVIGRDNKRRRQEEGSGFDAAVERTEAEQTVILDSMMDSAAAEDVNHEADRAWDRINSGLDALDLAPIKARAANPINWYHVPVLQAMGHDPYQAFMYHPHADRPVVERLPGAAMAAA